MISVYKTDRNGITTELQIDRGARLVILGCIMIAAAAAIVLLVHIAEFAAVL